jgi:gamma-glutamylcyclotransferase (GGCT)/AIG2-like uncharacterized protein YtfP
MKYFSYGSNMFHERLSKRVPSCENYRIGTLKKHVLKFHKRSQDDSGKCNAYFTGQEEDEILGVIYDIDPNEKHLLDQAEGLGNGYHESKIQLRTDQGTLVAFMYEADANAIDDKLVPYSWYKNYVIEGARQNNLPKNYMIGIEQIVSKSDPDKKREDKNHRILFGK